MLRSLRFKSRDAVQAKNESNTCNNQQAPQSLAALKQQTAGVANIRAGLAAIAHDIEAKTEKIKQAIASK